MALELFHRMQASGVHQSSSYTCLAALKACIMRKDLPQGRVIHGYIIKCGLQSDPLLDTVLHMYFKCNSLEEACRAFDTLPTHTVVSWNAVIAAHARNGGLPALICFEKMSHEGIEPNVVSWNTLIAGCNQDGEGHLALEFFQKMQEIGIKPNEITFSCVLKACSLASKLEQGKLIHGCTVKLGLQVDIYIANTLLDMYSKCGNIEEACKVFQGLLYPDLVSWGAMISGYAQNGQFHLATMCFKMMQYKGQKPNVVAWNGMIAGYLQYDEGLLALQTYWKMQEGTRPNEVTFTVILQVCASMGTIDQGKLVHGQILKYALQPHAVVGSALVGMYAKCSRLHEATQVFLRLAHQDVVAWTGMITAYVQCKEYLLAQKCFAKMQEEGPKPNIVSWNAIIAGYAQNGCLCEALECFKRMQEGGLKPDAMTFTSILKSCAMLKEVERGRLVHECMIESKVQVDDLVATTLIDMYAKCGNLEEAGKVFLRLGRYSVDSWNAMITGYNLQGDGIAAVECFERMQQEGIKADEVTFSSTLQACGTIGAIVQGRIVHETIVRQGLQCDAIMGNTLVDTYAKCGNIKEAQNVFKRLAKQSVVAWNAMIAGYAHHGEVFLALKYFLQMQGEGIMPDNVSYVSILNVCSCIGGIEEGHWYFRSMNNYHGILPTPTHCNCMVDILSRAACLREAEDLLQDMSKMSIIGWVTLLNACRIHRNIEIGKRCFDKILSLGSQCAVPYVLMSNIYRDASLQEPHRML